MALKSHYQIVVIGAGPAGLCAALRALSSGVAPTVLIVDRYESWKRPIACAEAVGMLGFHEAITVDPAWIRILLGKASFHAPGGPSVTYIDKNKGYIIDRARMQKDIAQRCIDMGAEHCWDMRVAGVGMREEDGREVSFADGTSVTADVVIDASGPLSSFGKNERIAARCPDLEPAYFAVIKGRNMPTDAVHIYVGRDLAPGGYAWVFPREEGTANAGVLVGSQVRGKVSLPKLLDAFLARHTPGAEVVARFAGPIPCASHRQPIAVAGLFKTGDAASTANPISRAGIVEAMISGGLAGGYAIDMLGAENAEKINRICKDYEKAWFEKRGKRHFKLAKVKNSLAQVPDADYDRAAQALSTVPVDQLLMSKVFSMSLGRFPRLVWAMRHLL